jgi:hypothetical protein
MADRLAFQLRSGKLDPNVSVAQVAEQALL